MPENIDIDKLLEQEVKKDAYRKEYNSRDDVKARRKVYNDKKREVAKIARAVLRGDISKEVGQQQVDAIMGATPASASEPEPAVSETE